MKISLINEKVWIGVLITLITSLGLMATDIYTPAMPEVTRLMMTSANMVQLTITVFLIAAGLSQLVYGPLSDQWGRRPILIAGLGIYILGSALCAVANDMPLLLLGRFVQGVGTGAVMALNRIIVRDTFSGPQLVKALSYIGAFIALAPAIAPVFGGFIESHWGWRWIFGFLLFYSLGLGVLAWFTLPETHLSRLNKPLSFGRVMSNYGVIIKNRHFWANVWCSGLAFSAMIICATINPFLLENGLGKTAGEYGFWAMLSAVGFGVGMLSNSYVVGRFGTERTLQIGNTLILTMALIFIVSGYFNILNVGIIIIPTIGIEMGIALVFPNAFIGAITPFTSIAGAAGAFYGFVQIGISFITSIVVAMMSESTQLPMGVLLFCTAGLGLLMYQLLKQPLQEAVDPSVTAGGH